MYILIYYLNESVDLKRVNIKCDVRVGLMVYVYFLLPLHFFFSSLSTSSLSWPYRSEYSISFGLDSFFVVVVVYLLFCFVFSFRLLKSHWNAWEASSIYTQTTSTNKGRSRGCASTYVESWFFFSFLAKLFNTPISRGKPSVYRELGRRIKHLRRAHIKCFWLSVSLQIITTRKRKKEKRKEDTPGTSKVKSWTIPSIQLLHYRLGVEVQRLSTGPLRIHGPRYYTLSCLYRISLFSWTPMLLCFSIRSETLP